MMAAASTAETALIVRVRLPEPLETLRVGAVPNASRGLPAHITLLYPFAAPQELDGGLQAAIALALERHHAFPYRLSGPARWPEVLFASVDPEGPFRSLYADLAAAFPDFPIYGGGFEFAPHVTVAEGTVGLGGLEASPAWATLPLKATASSVELIVLDEGAWTTRWRFPLGPAVRVLVCGERLRGDDGAARQAVEALDADTRALVEIDEVGQLSVEALLDVPEGTALVVVDAAVGPAPGSIVTLPLDEVGGRHGTVPASSHALPPDQVIGVAAEMRGSPLRGSFVGIGAVEFGFGAPLSRPVEAGLPAFATAIQAEIRRLAAG